MVIQAGNYLDTPLPRSLQAGGFSPRCTRFEGGALTVMTLYRFAMILIALFAGAACTDLDSATNLNPEGPPMIRQVRLRDISMDASGNQVTRLVFGFGTHPQATSSDYPALGANSMVTAAAMNNKFRVIIDELLVGNYLEEVACRAEVDDDAYDRVPVGATPEDIARCSVGKDVLPSSCAGDSEFAVCICRNVGGCGDVPFGGPVGVLDVNQDGAADDTRMIRGAAGIRCGTIDVLIDLNLSYWNPSGDQNKPAMGGFDALGPAVVIVPDGALPTNQRCQLVFSPEVVDKQNIQICAPPEGDITKTCTPGDTSAFEFLTQALTLFNQSFEDGDTGVDRNAPVILVATAPIAAGTLGAITVTQNGQPFTGFNVALPQPTTIRVNWTAPLAANTTYVITIATTLTDLYGQPLVTPITYTFTTGA
jgi:hypothetical protein